MNKPNFCQNCPINHLTEGYVPLYNPHDVDVLYVGEAAGEEEAKGGKPFQGGAGTWLRSLLKAANISWNSIALVNTIGCRPPNNIYPGSKDWTFTDRVLGHEAVQYCKEHHLKPALESKAWKRIVALGNYSLYSLTGKSGILTWQGSPLQLKDKKQEPPLVMPALHPAYIMRDARFFSTTRDHLKKPLLVPKESYNLFANLQNLREWKHKRFGFDLEWDRYGKITLCGLSTERYTAIVVGPIEGEILGELKRIFEEATDLIGQNIIGADLRFFRKLGWNVKAKLHDTMLKQHLIQPDLPHDLGFIACSWTQGVFWKGKGNEEEDSETGALISEGQQWRTWDNPATGIPVIFGGYLGCKDADEAFRLYNGRDTAKAVEANDGLQTQLEYYGMEDTYWYRSVPSAKILERITEPGWRIDPTRVKDFRASLEKKMVFFEDKLPEGLKPFEEDCFKHEPAPAGTYRLKTKKCKGAKKDGTSHETIDIQFTNPGVLSCPACGKQIDSGPMAELKVIKVPAKKRITPWNSPQKIIAYAKAKGLKPVQHIKTKRSSSDKRARKLWGRKATEFSIVDELKKLSTLYNTFGKEKWMEIDRVFYRVKVHGTSEGRFSCVGERRGLDPNLQQQPKEARILYLPDYNTHGLLQADWKSGENMITAKLANDLERLERLLQPGYNEHIDFGNRLFNTNIESKDDPLYKQAKSINHGRNYGMGRYKLRDQIFQDTGREYALKEIQEMIEEWKVFNRGTARWQAQTLSLVEEQGYLENPFGRKRWFSGRDFAGKALAFLPASTLADIMICSMVAFYADEFQDELLAMKVGVTGTLPEEVNLKVPVHDSFVFSLPVGKEKEVGRFVKGVMEQPWVQLDNFSIPVDLEWSTKSWGEMETLHVNG